MVIVKRAIVYKMYSRLDNKWFLVLASNGNDGLKKSAKKVSLKFSIPSNSKFAYTDVKEIIHCHENGLNDAIVMGLNKNRQHTIMDLPLLYSYLTG
jgi:hypothetical protein